MIPNLNHLTDHIKDAVEKVSGKDLAEVVKLNADLNAKALIAKSDILRGAVERKDLVIDSAYYNLGSGKVDFAL